MLRNNRKGTLIAKWKAEQDCSVDLPHTVRWSDGKPATLDDYVAHRSATREYSVDRRGVKLYLFPEVVAELHYDSSLGRWSMCGDGVRSAVLNITDRNASDETLLAEISTWTTLYQVRICR